MLHLLPQYQKRKVIKEYRMRLLVVITGLLLLAAIMFAVFTLPTYMTLQGQKKALESQKDAYLALIDAGKSKQGDSNLDIWKAADALKPYDKTLKPLLFIDAVAAQSSGIRIDGYALTQNTPTEPVAIVVTGLAKTREDATEYSKLLNVRFGGVKLPLSALAKQSDIAFDFRFQSDYAKAYEAVNGSTKDPVVQATGTPAVMGTSTIDIDIAQ